jgi:Tat protein translocase TatB subunit
MFDLSFGEIMLALVIAFVIFGPERFPVMLKEAIGWIKKVKNMAFEAQRSLDQLGQNIKHELPDASSWTPSSNKTEDLYRSSNSSALEPIQIDRESSFYTKEGLHWRKRLKIDRLPENYHRKALEKLPWEEDSIKPSPDLS